jgi:hypothetical protein
MSEKLLSERNAASRAHFCARGARTVSLIAGFILLNKLLWGNDENTRQLPEKK